MLLQISPQIKQLQLSTAQLPAPNKKMGKEERLLLFYNFLISFFLGFHEPPQTDFRQHQVNIAGKS
jgi:hypothetical protein